MTTDRLWSCPVIYVGTVLTKVHLVCQVYLLLLITSVISYAPYSNNNGPLSRPQPRPPYDLTIPSFAYVPEKYTGHMQYLPNQPIYAAEGVGPYVGLWGLWQANFRDTIPIEPDFDPIHANPIAYIDGHPVTQSPASAAAAAASGNSGTAVRKPNKKIEVESQQFTDLTIDTTGNKTTFRSCTTKASSSSFNRFGICVSDDKVIELCLGRNVVKSIICGQKESCCLDMGNGVTSSSSGLAGNISITTTKPPKQSRPMILVENTGSRSRLPPAFLDLSDIQTTDSPEIPTTGDPSKSFKACRSPNGFGEFGICVQDELVGLLCKNKFVARSSDCGNVRSCCVDAPDAVTSSSTTENTQPVPAVTLPPQPTVPPLVKNVVGNSKVGSVSLPTKFLPCISTKNSFELGVCINDNLLGQFCEDQFISKSTNCAPSQSCCIDKSSSSITPPPSLNSALAPITFSQQDGNPNVRIRNIRRKFPVGQPAVPRSAQCISIQTNTLGVCVNDLFVAGSCIGKALSRTNDCGPMQTCCADITQNDSFMGNQMLSAFTEMTTTSTTSTTTTMTQTEDPAAFLPCGHSQDSFSFGMCVEDQFLNQKCVGKTIFASDDCMDTQSCCVDTTSNSAPLEPLRLSVAPDQLGTTVPPTDLAPDNFVPSHFTPCNSPQHPFQFGVCVADSIVSSVCGGQFVAKTQDCLGIRSCCIAPFSGVSNALESRIMSFLTTKPTTTTLRPTTTRQTTAELLRLSAQAVFQQCIPIVNNFDVGVCVEESQVSRLCAGRLVAPSRSCSFDQSCCSYFPEPVVPKSRPTVSTTPMTTFTMPSTRRTTSTPATTSTLESGLGNSDGDQSGNILRPCVSGTGNGQPNKASSVGVCVNEDSAMDYCADKVLSVSIYCGSNQLCCSQSDKK